MTARSVTITGGSGFVGQLLRRGLRARGYRVHVFDRLRAEDDHGDVAQGEEIPDGDRHRRHRKDRRVGVDPRTGEPPCAEHAAEGDADIREKELRGDALERFEVLRVQDVLLHAENPRQSEVGSETSQE